MQVNKIHFSIPVFFDKEEIEKFSLSKHFFIKVGQFADAYLSCGEDQVKIKASTLEEVKVKIPVWIKVAKVASYILSVGILPLAALAVKAIYKKYCENYIEHNSQPSSQQPVKTENEENKPSFSAQPVTIEDHKEDDSLLISVSKAGHHRTCSLNDYFEKYAQISKEGSEFLTKIDEYQASQAGQVVHPPLVRRPRFRNVNVPVIPPPPLPTSQNPAEDINNVLRRSTEIIKKEPLKRILESKDPLLTKYILAKLDIFISDHMKIWEKNKVDAAICYPLSLEVFADIYYCKATKNIYIATQKFASGMFNEVVRGYDWKTGEEAVLRRRIPLDNHEEALIEDSKRQFILNQEINKRKIPNFIEAKGFIQVENQAIIVLEKMQGCELQDFLSSDTVAFSTAQQKQLILGLMKTVRKLHNQGITHGDIQPKNLFVYVEKEEIRLTLFDLDKTEKDDNKNNKDFLLKAREDINLMGKLLFGVLFSKEFKGEEQGYQVMRDKLGQPQDKNSIEAICLEMINAKVSKGQLTISLKDLIKRLA